MAKNRRERGILRDSLGELKSTLQAANKLVPGCVVVAMLLTAAVISVSLLSIQLMMGIIILIVLLVSIVVYSRTDNYGEAALALVAGLLTAFTVSWNARTFTTFVVIWVALSLFSFLISSVKLAAEKEEIYADAARSIDPGRSGEVRKQLEQVGEDKFIRMLGPIKRAEVIRLFAFRKIPLASMQYGLRAVETLSTVTRVDHEIVAEFVVDVYKMFRSTPGPRYQNLLDRTYEIIRDTPVSPGEFIAAFKDSRHLALSGAIDPETFFRHLQKALDQGVAPEEVCEYLREQPYHSGDGAAESACASYDIDKSKVSTGG